jgi:hypothetical protein
LTPLELTLERAKAADREAISGALRKLKQTDAYKAAGAEEQKGMEEACRAEVIERRYIGSLPSLTFTNLILELVRSATIQWWRRSWGLGGRRPPFTLVAPPGGRTLKKRTRPWPTLKTWRMAISSRTRPS